MRFQHAPGFLLDGPSNHGALVNVHWIFTRILTSFRIASAHVSPSSSHVSSIQDPTAASRLFPGALGSHLRAALWLECPCL